jgi:hypothetical protein
MLRWHYANGEGRLPLGKVVRKIVRAALRAAIGPGKAQEFFMPPRCATLDENHRFPL